MLVGKSLFTALINIKDTILAVLNEESYLKRERVQE